MSKLQEAIANEKKVRTRFLRADPKALDPTRPFEYDNCFEKIGILTNLGQRKPGHLKVIPDDFIVEEISTDGKISSVDAKSTVVPDRPSDREYLWGDLVKSNISTLDAFKILVDESTVSNLFGYAGLKDKRAVTAQRVSLDYHYANQVNQTSAHNVRLQNLEWRSEPIRRGELEGNQFTIVVRVQKTPNKKWLPQMEDRFKHGYRNYYGPQRFGTPRLVSHDLGRLLIKRDWEGAFRKFLLHSCGREARLVQQLRMEASGCFGEWKKMESVYSLLPYTFRHELRLLQGLGPHPKGYPARFEFALGGLHSQLEIWLNAYSSYLFNLHLSGVPQMKLKAKGYLPLLSHPRRKGVAVYQKQLELDDISFDDLEPISYKAWNGNTPFAWKSVSDRNVRNLIVKARDMRSLITHRAVHMSFALPKSAYASVVLAHLFSLSEGSLGADWIDHSPYDAKSLLGTGSLDGVEERMLSPAIDS